MRLLFEKIYRKAPFAGLFGVSSNNGFPRINKAIRDLGWLGGHYFIKLGILREAVNEWDNVGPIDKKALAGSGVCNVG